MQRGQTPAAGDVLPVPPQGSVTLVHCLGAPFDPRQRAILASAMAQLHRLPVRDYAREAALPRWGWLVSELRNSVGMHSEPEGEDRADVIRYVITQCGSPRLAEELLDLAIHREAIGAPHDEEI